MVNVDAYHPHPVKELALRVAEAMGVEPSIVHLPTRNEVYIAFSDHSACREVFSPNSETSLEDGLRKMAAWVKKVGSRKSKNVKEIEVGRSLPRAWLDEM
jgi:UDP-glucose 4-epimerase